MNVRIMIKSVKNKAGGKEHSIVTVRNQGGNSANAAI